jgi:hypothetical protein
MGLQTARSCWAGAFQAKPLSVVSRPGTCQGLQGYRADGLRLALPGLGGVAGVLLPTGE